MWNKTKQGWIMSLRNESPWGSVKGFFDYVRQSEKKNGLIILEAPIYGKIQAGDKRPSKGDGIGFYHSTRAKFDGIDDSPKQPRLSLIGEIVDIEYSERDLKNIRAEIDPKCLELMERNPIMRNKHQKLFEGANIRQGVVATLYYAEPKTWQNIVKIIL